MKEREIKTKNLKNDITFDKYFRHCINTYLNKSILNKKSNVQFARYNKFFSNILMIGVILLILINSIDAGTITGSVSFTPTEIRTDADYTFTLANSRNLEADEVSYFIIIN